MNFENNNFVCQFEQEFASQTNSTHTSSSYLLSPSSNFNNSNGIDEIIELLQNQNESIPIIQPFEGEGMLRNFEDDLNSRTTSPDLVKTLKRTSDADTVSTSGLGEVQQKSRKQSRSFPPKTDPDYQAYRSRNNKAVKKWRKKEKARQEDHQATIDALVSENQQLKEQNNELKIELKAIRSVFKVCGCCGSK